MLAVAFAPVPALAQDASAEARLRRLEAEVRALQRQVFPGGDGRFFQPEITAPPASAAPVPAGPSSTALGDVLARLEALERQLQTLTAQIEVGGNTVATLSERVEALEAAGRAAAAQPSAPVPVAGSGAAAATPGSSTAGAAPAPRPAADAQRLAAVQAITKPSTGNPGEDEYVYGFRLFEAGFYPEAQQQLTLFLNAHPRHARATYGRNLLGRAYLADNKPREAAGWFLNNYQSDRTAARAGDSLLGLAQAMIALQDTQRACVALAEFAEGFPALATGRLRPDYEAARRQVRCS
ncbi:hypothetical protein EYB45_09375 [Erythrobacteraceae bacterium CFH 75059]|nr:hypothetical protein EYB45_09375 [Erythrobacteraceae bacterium CFH 75059]